MSYTRGMKIVATLIVALAALCVAVSAQARTVDLSIVNQTHLSAAQVERAEQAVAYQVNYQLRRYWNVPAVQFVPTGGYQIYLVGGQGVMGGGGAHFPAGATIFGKLAQPSAFAATGSAKSHFKVASTGGTRVSWTVALSHEVLEMMVDPRTNRRSPHRIHHLRVWVEVADPVEADTYLLHGVRVSDFVTPRWFEFSNVNFMPYDFRGVLSAPYTIAKGGYVPGQP